MSYVVYADVMLVWIFMINYLTYYITCKIINHRLSKGILIIWSLISAVLLELVYILFIYSNNEFLKLLYISVNIAMYLIFTKQIIKTRCTTSFIRMLSYSLLGTLILAGIVMVFTPEKAKINVLTPVIITVCIIIPLIFKICPTNATQTIYQVEIHTNHKVINTYGYLDTGNNLIDIYSNKPVIILDYRLINEIIFEKDKPYLEKYINTGNYQYIANLIIDNELLHPICYKTVSNEFSIIPAFKIKCLILNKKQIYKNIICAISKSKLSNTNDYMVLLNNNL
ncbi:MAG: sigma-E processing peptidase SpoIIGA [Lachnospiraceae bacterium]|nr:sigma-E processing peptidase SpoIIGA [Lachnospiraceae bacterium]